MEMMKDSCKQKIGEKRLNTRAITAIWLNGMMMKRPRISIGMKNISRLDLPHHT